MGSFDKYSNYDENTGFSSVVFGSDKPVLEVELNEMQQILNTKISRLIKVLGNCVTPLSDGNINFNKDTQELTLTDCVVLEKSGFTFYVKSATTTLDSENKYAYFKVEEVDLDSKSSMREYGNELGDLVPNPIRDSRSPAETSRRKAISYSLLSGSYIPENTDTLKYVSVGEFNDEGVEDDDVFSTSSSNKLETVEEVSQYITNISTTLSYLGQGFGVCETETKDMIVSLPDYTPINGGFIAVKFKYEVPAGATLNVNDKGAKEIYYRGISIDKNIIRSGDTALFGYDGTFYHLLSIDRSAKEEDICLSLLQDCDTNFNEDGSVTEVTPNYTATTVFNDDDSITTTYRFNDGTVKVKTTTFSEDGNNIKDVVRDGE